MMKGNTSRRGLTAIHQPEDINMAIVQTKDLSKTGQKESVSQTSEIKDSNVCLWSNEHKLSTLWSNVSKKTMVKKGE
jgi:hypothetical protein